MRGTLLLLLVLAACAENRYRMYVDHQRGIDGGWASGKGRTRLDATGEVVTIQFMNRLFRIENMKAFRGYIDHDSVMLRGENIKVLISPKTFEVVERGASVTKPLSEIREGGAVRYIDGELQVR